MQAHVGLLPKLGLPPVKLETDIYKTGSICQVKTYHDKQNPYSPFILNLFPLRKAVLSSFVDPVAPLARVLVDEVKHLET